MGWQMSERMKRLWPRLLFTAVLGVGCLLYLWDAASQSTRVTNLILLLPTTLIAVVLCIIVMAEDIGEARKDGPSGNDAKPTAKLDWRIPTLMALVGAYVATIMTLGAMDLATVVFVAACLILLGERRPWAVGAFSIGYSLLLIKGLELSLSYDVPTLWL